MTYLITTSDGRFLLELDNNVIDNTTTSLTLVGESVVNYGSYVDQNFVNLLDRFSNGDSPAIPIIGQNWYDRNNKLLRIFNGYVWDTVSSPFNGESGIVKITILAGSSPIKVVATIVQFKILSVYTHYTVDAEYIPETVTISNTQFLFKSLFPNGLKPGVNLAIMSNVTLEYHGNSYSTSKLRTPVLIGLSGDFSGNVLFDGGSNVNVIANFNNLYVPNSNAFISGSYSNATVDDTGRIVNLGNITFNDVISALGYVPYSDSNASVDTVPNTLVVRDAFGSFSANLINATTTYTTKFTSNVTIRLTGDIEGSSIGFNSSSNVIVASNRASPGNIMTGVYNTLTVNSKGVIESATLVENMPIGAIVLYNNSVVIPEGWALCNGGNTVTPSGQTVTTPNLTNVAIGGTTYIMKVFRNIYLPSNDTIVGTLSINLVGGGVPVVTFVGGPDIKYPPLVFSNVNVATSTATVSTYTKIKKSYIPDGFKGSRNTPTATNTNGNSYRLNDILYFNFPNYDKTSSAKVTEIGTNGGITKIEILEEGKYKPFVTNALGLTASSLKSVRAVGGSGQDAIFDLEIERINQPSIVTDVDFQDNLFFDAVSVILSGGDANAVMLSQANIFGDLSNLTVIQIITNLTVRRQSGLPPRLGKYMLSLDDIINYSGVLKIPVNITNFSIALQNRLMLLKITDFSNEFSYLGYYPTDDKLFGAAYIGLSQYVAILKGNRSDRVGNTLVNAGFQLTGMNTVDNLTNDLFLTYVSKMMVNAKVAIFNNNVARNTALEVNALTKTTTIPVPPPFVLSPLLTTGNANIIISESVIDGIAVIYGGVKPTTNTTIEYGGGAFVLGGPTLNSDIYSVVNGAVYGNSGVASSGQTSSSGSSGGGGGSDRNSPFDNSDPGLDTGTGSKFKSTVDATSNYTTQGGGTTSYVQTGDPADFGKGYTLSYGEIESIIRHEATLRGIDPNVAVAVYGAEGKGGYQSGIVPTNPNVDTVNGREASFGPFQLYTGGGVGNRYEKVTGRILTEDNTPIGIITQVRFALDVVASEGWGQWYGAAAIGVSNRQGLAGSKPINNLTDPVSVDYFPIVQRLLPESATVINNITSSDVVKGLTSAATRLSNAVSPLPAISTILTVSVLPLSVAGLVGVARAVAVAVTTGTIVATVGSKLIDSIGSVLENAGITPPAIKPPTAVGGTTTSYVRPALPVASSSSSGSSSGNSGYSLGGTSLPSTGPTVTVPKPAGDFIVAPSKPLSFSSSDTGGRSASSGVQSSGASLSYSSSVSSPSASSGSTATYSMGTPVNKPTTGGSGSSTATGGGAGNTGGAFSLKGCFVFDTLINMADGTVKKIGELTLGDKTRGGEVVATHCYNGAPLYDYLGVHVSGTHYVIENGLPVMVQDTAHAFKIDDVYGLYTVDTTERRIFANGIEFADHNGDGVIFDFFENANRTAFDSINDIYQEILNQVKNAKL